MEGGAEQRQAWLLRELQGVNRQLSHEVSTLANENLRLKSAATTADMSLLEAAVAQKSHNPVGVSGAGAPAGGGGRRRRLGRVRAPAATG